MGWLAAFMALVAGVPLTGGKGREDLRTYAVDRRASHVYIVTHRSGLLSFFGHEHAIVPLSWTPALCLASPVPAGAHGSLVIDVASLVIDSDSARALAGLGGGPSESEKVQIQRKMLDANHLDAARYPTVRLDVVALAPAEGGRVTARATVALHGLSRELPLPIRVETGENGLLTLAGDLRIRQRDFGIVPETVAGVVKVANEVDLHFQLVARPTDDRCTR